MNATFQILAGLPATGPYPEQFSVDGRGMHREGFVLRVTPGGGAPWAGNFQRGLTGFSGAFPHPDGTSLVVIAGGDGYVVDPETRALRSVLAGVYSGAWIWNEGSLLILDHSGVSFESIGPDGTIWTTRRISWDGFRDVRIKGEKLLGEAWSPAGNYWSAFEVDLRTGDAAGGAYEQGTPL